MRGKIKRSCLRSWTTGWGFQSVSHVWPLCCFEALLSSLKQSLLACQESTCESPKPRRQLQCTAEHRGHRSTTVPHMTGQKSKIESAWRQPHTCHAGVCVALVKGIATKRCDVNVTFAALVVALFHLWTDRWHSLTTVVLSLKSGAIQKRKGALKMGCSDGY